MKIEIIRKSGKPFFLDPIVCYVLSIAAIIFLYITFHYYALAVYEHFIIIPCFLFWGAVIERKTDFRCRGRFLLAGIMAAWFLLLQLKRIIAGDTPSSVGLFLSTYLFAFPLVSLLNDGDEKKALKIFAGTYLAAASVLAAYGLLLILDCLPDIISRFVFWTGARLEVFWHPNVAASFFMIGIVFCTTFWAQAKTYWSKLFFSVLLVLLAGVLALTSCRTVTILTGGFLGALIFFQMINRGKKWFLPGLLAVVVLTSGFYVGTRYVYQANNAMLLEKYTQQYSDQLASESADSASVNTVDPQDAEASTVPETVVAGPELNPDIAAEASCDESIIAEENPTEAFADDTAEEIPLVVDPNTGNLILNSGSPQGSIVSDFGTLNNRTHIWRAAFLAIRENPSIRLWGVAQPGTYVSDYCIYPIMHMHNAWIECLVGMGVVGFLIAVMFTLIAVWNILITLIKHHQDLWRRNIALLTMCILVASLLEPYLFCTTNIYHPVDFLFFLCTGYLAHWQEEDNRCIMGKIRRKLFK